MNAGDLFERPHVAEGVIWSERDGRTFQACKVCGAELVGAPTGAGVALDTFDTGARRLRSREETETIEGAKDAT